MANRFLLCGIVLISIFEISHQWKAIPAEQAMYGAFSTDVGIGGQQDGPKTDVGIGRQQARPKTKKTRKPDPIPLDRLPKKYLHGIYKFGQCRPGNLKRQFLRTTINLTLDTLGDAFGRYLYVIGDMSTQQFTSQCIVMKMYVARVFLFYRARLPMYYCQSELFIHMLNTINRLAFHEFYTEILIRLPFRLLFEFYHPNMF